MLREAISDIAYRFVQGLISIGILNQVLVIFDNDAEGSANFGRVRRLRLPANMRVMKLPDHPNFQEFDTTGPTGTTVEDINGRAAAIECYLDLNWQIQEAPRARWTTYNSALDRYQGELVNKEAHTRHFLTLPEQESRYDLQKMQKVVEAIIAECVAIAEGQ